GHFGLPTLAGNVVGGSLIFALISHAQVRSDSHADQLGSQEAVGFPTTPRHAKPQNNSHKADAASAKRQRAAARGKR
ncbi:MAG TPA: hypothetical protein VIQ48_04730, partial [Rhodanobacter sp.]